MKEKLENINMFSFIINTMLGIRLITLPRDIGRYAERDSWISIIIMGFISVLTGYTFYWLGTKHKNLDFSQITEKILGKYIGKVAIIVIEIYILLSIGLGLRIFGDSVKIFLLDKTPMSVIIFIMILCCAYCVLNGVKTISIVSDIFLFPILIFLLFLIILPLNGMDPKSLLPIGQQGIIKILRGGVEITDSFIGVGIIGYIMPYIINHKNIKKYIFSGIIVSFLVYLAIVVSCIMVFGSKEINYLIYPGITLSKAIRLRLQVFERGESLFMASWVLNTFTTLIMYYFASTLNLKTLFNTNKEKTIIYTHIPIFILISLFPSNIVQTFKYLHLCNFIAQFLNFVFIPLLIIIFLFKERRSDTL